MDTRESNSTDWLTTNEKYKTLNLSNGATIDQGATEGLVHVGEPGEVSMT